MTAFDETSSGRAALYRSMDHAVAARTAKCPTDVPAFSGSAAGGCDRDGNLS